MKDYQLITTIFDAVSDYYQSIKLETERGGFGHDVYKSEQKLLDYINSAEAPHECNWATYILLTQNVAASLDDCYNYMIANEVSINSKSRSYLQILEFIVNCLDYIQLTTGIKPNQTVEKDRLSKWKTKRADKYFKRALEKGFMEQVNDGYKWIWGAKARLAYFLHKVYNPNGIEQVPYKALERLFNVKRLDTAIDQTLNAKKVQKWRAEIETEILFD